jgi:aspartate aminotransferase
VQGLAELREATVNYHKRKIGIEYHPDNVIVGPGSKQLMFDLQMTLQAELILPSPSWVSYYPQARILQREATWLDCKLEDDWKLHPDTIERHCASNPTKQRLLILNYPNNPTGTCMTADELKAIAEVCRKYKIVVLADEIYMDLHHTSKYFSIAQFYPEGTILSTGLSKWAGAGGWRLGTFVCVFHCRLCLFLPFLFTNLILQLSRVAERRAEGHVDGSV